MSSDHDDRKEKDGWVEGALGYNLLFNKDEFGLEKGFVIGERNTTRKRLLEAYQEMKGAPNGSADEEAGLPPTEMFGLHECFNLASSILLMGAKADVLKRKLPTLHQGIQCLKNMNSMTIASAVILYHLVTDQIWLAKGGGGAADPTALQAFEYIHRRFDALNWMVGQDAMKALGIQALAPPQPAPPKAG